MSNEPKWKKGNTPEGETIAVYKQGEGFINVFEPDADYLCDTLNLLDSEVERLKEERDNAVKMCDSIYKVDKREIEQLQSDLDRCKAERLGAEEIEQLMKFYYSYDGEPDIVLDWHNEDLRQSHLLPVVNTNVVTTQQLITAFRASQKTQEGKG